MPRALRKLRRFGLVLYAGAIGVGLARFAADRAYPETPVVTGNAAAPGEPARNLAAFDAGGRARASSYDAFHHHHLMFAIDGEPRPTEVERWVSHPGDAHPWIEVLLPGPADLERVVLTALAPPATGLQVTCWGASDDALLAEHERPATAVGDIDLELRCTGARRLRIELEPPRLADPRVSLTEIEVWGVPR